VRRGLRVRLPARERNAGAEPNLAEPAERRDNPVAPIFAKEILCVPADFRQWCHGYVVTSDKAEKWTADHVVVAAERLNSKGAYVACSRGRRSRIVHTRTRRARSKDCPRNRRAGCVFRDPPRNAPIVNTCQSMEATLLRPSATPRRASNSTIDRPDANCVSAKASEPEYLGKTTPYRPTDCVCD
jgi:hypothetical protein